MTTEVPTLVRLQNALSYSNPHLVPEYAEAIRWLRVNLPALLDAEARPGQHYADALTLGRLAHLVLGIEDGRPFDRDALISTVQSLRDAEADRQRMREEIKNAWGWVEEAYLNDAPSAVWIKCATALWKKIDGALGTPSTPAAE